MNWRKGFKGVIKPKELLCRHTTFRIGGPADLFISPRDQDDLKFLITSLKRYTIPFFIIGAGSNLLVSDKGVRAAVIKLDAPFFRRAAFRGTVVEASSGASLGKLIAVCAARGLSGLEFLTGVPGTLGGALVMNAGAWGSSIADLVQAVTVMDSRGIVRTLKKKQAGFSYRSSRLNDYIVLGAFLKLRRASVRSVRSAIRAYAQQRRKAQDCSKPNAGCVFKNPAGHSAGKLIDMAGLKGAHVGGAQVSCRHANFILNQRRARSGDVLKLMELVRKKVKARYRVSLEPEIKIWK